MSLSGSYKGHWAILPHAGAWGPLLAHVEVVLAALRPDSCLDKLGNPMALPPAGKAHCCFEHW